jgi:hypothetical protein
VLVPLAMVKALCALVGATEPERLVLRRDEDDRAWFTGQTRDGARWTLSGRVNRANAPDYGAPEREAVAYSACDVDAAELRALARSASHVAIMPCGGIVAWGAPSEGIGTSLASWDGSTDPLVVFLAPVLKAAIGALPKTGKVRVSVDAAGLCNRIGETLTAGINTRAFPEHVAQALALTFGLACEVPIVRRQPADIVREALATAKPDGRWLATALGVAVQTGDFSKLGGELAGAVLALARPTGRAGGTFLEFDPAPFMPAAAPLAVKAKRAARLAA